MKLLKVHLNNNYEDILKISRNILPEIEYQEVVRFKFDADKVRKLSSILLINFIAKKFFNLKKYKIKKNEYGKPFFDSLLDAQFNISHSGSWVLAAVSNDAIGVDVEKVKPMNDLLSLAKRFFSNKECTFINSMAENNKQLNAFFEIWAKKESFVKSVGKGISLQLNSFSVPLKKKDKTTIFYDSEYWTFTYLADFDDCYKACVCEKSNEKNKLVVESLTIEELLSFY